MDEQKKHSENPAEKSPLQADDGKSGDKKEAEKMSAADYIARALADPAFGDSRRDELALAALKFAARFRAKSPGAA